MKGTNMVKRQTKVIGAVTLIGALAFSATAGVGTVSAQSFAAKAGISRPAHDGRGPGGMAKSATEVASLLKLTEAELKAQLVSGKSLADVAKAQGVEVSAVVDLLVAKAQAHLAEAVTEGKMTQAEADAKLAEVTTRVTDKVNKVRPVGMGDKPGRGGRGGRGHGGRGHHGNGMGKAGNIPEPAGVVGDNA
jgi:hypothetical protein